MTIASEITRLNNSKSDIKTAIENKWVTVPSTDKIDCYASCIDAIQSWNNTPFIDLLVVWWGWWWGWSYWEVAWWWGWGWWFIECKNHIIDNNFINITVWEWWKWWWISCTCYWRNRWWENWWDSCFWEVIAYWWGWWWWVSCCEICNSYWRNWWSWWWNFRESWFAFRQWWRHCSCQWNDGWWASCCYANKHWGWWGWAWWAWMPAWITYLFWEWNNITIDASTIAPWSWWLPIQSSISWESKYYWGWWGWWSSNVSCDRPWCWWGMNVNTWAWNWGATYYNWCNWTNWTGGWWWGAWYASTSYTLCWWNWWSWIVILRYKTDWSYWIDPSCAFWGCKYTCWDYTIHCFDTVWNYFFSTNWCEIKQPWIYHNPTLWLITILQDENNLITLCDRNEWASWINQQWCVYQRWNNYWFPATWSIPATTSQINASWYWPWNYFCRNCFIYDGSWTNRDWSSVRNDNLRWWVTNTNEARRWPLAEWFHIPSPQNYRDMINIFCWAVWRSLTCDDTKNLLFFMNTCWRAYNNTSVYSGCASNTWTSSIAIYDAYISASEYYNCAPTATNYLNRRWTLYQIRAFKNTPVIPTVDWWSKLL